VDVNLCSADSESPLWIACAYGFKEVVACLLLAKHININLPDKNNETPIRIAKRKKHLLVVQLLREHGALE
jgi:ankyrin repeat protein